MRRTLGLLLISGMALAGCSSAEQESVTYTDPANLSLFKVPQEWNLYELNELSALDDLPFHEDFQGFSYPAVSSVAFDGAPARNVGNVTMPLTDATYPIGASSVLTVGEFERDLLSRATLAQTVLPYYRFNPFDEIAKEDFTFGDGFDGVRLLVSYGAADGQSVGVAYIIAVSDAADSKIYSIVAGCSRQCFIDHQEQIEKVVDSWLVNKRAS
jgi:hypothetical protein